MRVLSLAAGVAAAAAFTAPHPAARPTLVRRHVAERTRAARSPLATEAWAPDSWRSKKALQLPTYPDQEALEAAEAEIAASAPLIFAGEVRELQDKLKEATLGNAFLLMGGDCAESFNEFSVDHVRDTFRVILQMALTMTYGGAQPVIKVGRMAGQFAKPRSSNDETKDGITLPSYRGDNINDEAFTEEGRIPDPRRMVKAYHQCAQTLNILRAFSTGGYADISRLQAWNMDFVEQTAQGSRYRLLCSKIEEALRFVEAIGVDTTGPEFARTEFYTAHECLLLQYEQALTRQDSTTGRWYDCSAHMLWVGERTRDLDNAHLEFVRGIGNPIGVKISDKCDPAGLIKLLDIVNPLNTPGRVTLITRMGAEKIYTHLPALIRAVQTAGKSVLWISDPVHGNTETSPNGYKTRDFAKVLDEIAAFFDVHESMGTHPGGVHLEMTGEDVTECIGGLVDKVTIDDLSKRYHTHCDPRLNAVQATEIAFQISERMRERAGLPPLDFCVDLPEP